MILRMATSFLPRARRSTVAQLVLLMLVATAFRTARLGSARLSNDEVFTWRVVSREWQQMINQVAGDTHPPGHFILLKSWTQLFGDSEMALRMLSVLCGVLCVPIVFCAARDAIPDNEQNTYGHRAAIAAAALVAVHWVQVDASRTARMYSLGALAAACAAWTLIRALRRHRWQAWMIHGVALAGFLYAHHYAIFAILGESLFVASQLLRGTLWRQVGADRAAVALGFLSSITVAGCLYSLWLPNFLDQAYRVKSGFWIPAADWQRILEALSFWTTGLASPTRLELILQLTILGALLCAIALIVRGTSSVFLFLAATPWIGTFAVSIIGGRPLLQERYFTFSQVAFLALAGLTARSKAVIATAAFFIFSAIVSVGELVEPPRPSRPLELAANFLVEHTEHSDVVLVNGPEMVNHVRYYSRAVPGSYLHVKCLVADVPGSGQLNHVAALDKEEVIWSDGRILPVWERIWKIVNHRSANIPAPEGYRLIQLRHFGGGFGVPNGVTLALFLLED
jgi:uncharacterized membrane protein